jgi:truncated hemoglobin YjbI
MTTTSQTNTPLYQRLTALAGTEDVFRVVAERLYDRILGPVGGDPDQDGDVELVRFFHDADGRLIDRARLQQHMTHFLMAAFGGPPRYTGRAMAAAHAGRQITDEAFDRVIGHVVAVLESLQVPAEWIAEIGAAVAPLRGHVVTATGAD